MIRIVIAALIFVLTAAASHIFVLSSIPGFVMNKAFSTMEVRGIPLHQFTLVDRASPQNQTIVRPSPDLAYSICRFDLSDGPVRISGATWEGYASLSVFDSQTNNVFVTSLDAGADEPRSVIIALEGEMPSQVEGDVIMFKDPRGLALIRRLAPSDELFEQVQSLSLTDACLPLATS